MKWFKELDEFVQIVMILVVAGMFAGLCAVVRDVSIAFANRP